MADIYVILCSLLLNDYDTGYPIMFVSSEEEAKHVIEEWGEKFYEEGYVLTYVREVPAYDVHRMEQFFEENIQCE